MNSGVAFVFSGMGSQWPRMGQRLLEHDHAYRQTLLACDTAVRGETGWSVVEVLSAGDPAKLRDASVAQPTLWAVQTALAALWRSRGVPPDVVIGHSMGEIAAAVAVDALTIADAARVVCRRSALAAALGGTGTMAVLPLSATAAQDALHTFGISEEEISIAAINSPTSTVIAGGRRQLLRFLDQVEDALGVAGDWIRSPFASHTARMDPLLEELTACLSDLRPRSARDPIHSTTVARRIDGRELDARYWAHNIRRPVRFAEAVQAELGQGVRVLLEISPHPVLRTALTENVRHADVPVLVLGSLRRDEDEVRTLGTTAHLLTSASLPAGRP
jgi:acyl transferase domain-containing protein